MDFELRAARAKLEREQKERKEKARLKLERERKAKQEASRQREALEAANRTRRLDAAEAQLKADQIMEESRISGQGVMFHRMLEAIPYQGIGDKIKLPSSCFTELSDQGALDKGPMYFKLSEASGQQNPRVTHSGVLEFTSPEGSVELPPHVWNNLFPTTPTSPFVEVQYVRLPKGVYAKLQPDGRGFSDIPNHKAVLETCLRQHATLSQGDVVTVNHGELIFKLQVLELKPASSVSVLETDIEVEIVGSDSTSTDQHVLLPLVIGKTETGYIEEEKYIYYKFSLSDEVIEKIISVKIETENDNADTDLYVSKHPVIFPNQHQHEWSSHDVGSKILILTPMEAGVYTIGVYGFKGASSYKISVSVQENSNNPKMGEVVVDADSVACSNCHHYIPTRTIALHEAYCARHNVQCKYTGCGVVLRREEAGNHIHCEKCGKAFQEKEIAKHMKVFHEPLRCSCGVVLEKEAMVQHQLGVCPLRLVTCRFCGDMVQAGSSASDARDRLRGLSEHESVCGSRTAPCDSCGRSVMLKEMDIHQVAVHQKS